MTSITVAAATGTPPTSWSRKSAQKRSHCSPGHHANAAEVIRQLAEELRNNHVLGICDCFDRSTDQTYLDAAVAGLTALAPGATVRMVEDQQTLKVAI